MFKDQITKKATQKQWRTCANWTLYWASTHVAARLDKNKQWRTQAHTMYIRTYTVSTRTCILSRVIEPWCEFSPKVCWPVLYAV